MKMMTLVWKTRLRPNWSPSLPATADVIVWASRYDVTTHETWLPPPRSPTIVGRAVDTIVLSSAASRIPSAIVANATVRARP